MTFSKTAHDAPKKRKSLLTNDGKLWYNTYSNRARCVCSRSSDYFRLRITTAVSKARWLFLFVAAGSDPLTKETHISSDKRSIDEHYMYRLAEKLGQYIQKSHLDRPLSQLLARNFIASSVCCSESDLHLALPALKAPQLHWYYSIFWQDCKVFCKK